ncbi:MAG TPA: PAS domain S-box protein [Oligoflexia bacterium]|nr:PAS domain S-box protein [Oligoflexia bacterium]HMR25173.1 PAS domain S-box protein [Oligoflexia bacterium]
MKKILKSDEQNNALWLQSFLSYANDAFIVCDKKFNILYANPKSSMFIDKKPSELIGSNIEDCGIFGSLISTHLSDTIKKNKAQSHHYSYTNNKIEFIEVSYTPIPNKNSIQVILIIRNITKKKRALRELEFANKRLEIQAKALQHYNIVSESDLFGNILYASESFLKLSGFTIEDLLHKNYRDFNSGHHDSKFFETLWKTIIDGKVWSGLIKNKFKNNKVVWLETIISPVHDKKGKIIKFLCMQRDISDQQFQFEEGQDFLLRFREAFMQSPIIFISLDLAGNILFTNHFFSNLVGLEQEDLKKKNFINLFIDSEEKNETQRKLLSVISKKTRAKSFKTKIITSKNATHTIQWKASATTDGLNTVNGLTLIGENITQKNIQKNKLSFLEKNLAQQQKKTFSFITHQLKGGLNSIDAGLDLLADFDAIKGHKESLNITLKIKDRVKKLKILNHKFLETLKNTNKDLVIHKQKFDIYPIIKEALKENIFKSKTNADFTIDFKPACYSIHADPFIFKEILNNLINNSLKYAKNEQAIIKVTAHPQEHNFILCLSDDGKGMTQEQASKAFIMFERGDSKKKGHGIGLQFCQDMMKKHRGKIWLETELNVGTSVFLCFPNKTKSISD